MNTEYHFFATCAKGVEDLVQAELKQLQIKNIRCHTGGVAFDGELKDAYRACLWSRVASRILYQLQAFEIASDDDLYSAVSNIDWSIHFDVDNTLTIDCFSSHSVVNNSHYAALRVKDAIVDQFMERVGQRPSIDRDRPDIRLNVYLSDRQCLLYLDLSGDALHKRGYRQQAGEAPLRETLAASILYRARWQSFFQQGAPLFDPMCGSGTLLIEAAMMAADIAPGLQRESFGFTYWKQFDQGEWSAIVAEAERRKVQGQSALPSICGSDSSEQLVATAKNNIRAAGLSEVVEVRVQDATRELKFFCGSDVDKLPGLIATNPPYGKRIGQIQLLRTVYHRFGKQLKANFDGWTVAVITSEPELAKSIGMRAFRKNSLYNGAIKSVLYQYHVNTGSKPATETKEGQQSATGQPHPTAAGEVVTTGNEGTNTEHAAMFINRLKKNYKHLKKWARRNQVSCYRVYDADIPQYAVAIDKYEQWIHVQEYQAPKTIDSNRAFQRINDVIDVVADILETEQAYVVLKVRKRQEGRSQYERQDQKQRKLSVRENGLKFLINMYDYIDTGLFLDHRLTRQLIRQMSPGQDFLNLFAYTGSVSVYAAAGDAKTTTTVDMSNTYLKWAQENMSINGFTGDRHRFVRDDCLSWMQQAIADKLRYSLIFIDPPTFSNSKKMSTSLDIIRDHVALLSGCLSLLSDGGRIIFSTNARGFVMDDEIVEMCQLKEITAMTTSEDFRRKPLHRCWCLANEASALELPSIR